MPGMEPHQEWERRWRLLIRILAWGHVVIAVLILSIPAYLSLHERWGVDVLFGHAFSLHTVMGIPQLLVAAAVSWSRRAWPSWIGILWSVLFCFSYSPRYTSSMVPCFNLASGGLTLLLIGFHFKLRAHRRARPPTPSNDARKPLSHGLRDG